ncbi:MAG: tetratricopeptide repeat protein [Thermoplasmata archaeon]|nr:tetratricopeptide repeat protein [Thermoplasmata archaeon]
MKESPLSELVDKYNSGMAELERPAINIERVHTIKSELFDLAQEIGEKHYSEAYKYNVKSAREALPYYEHSIILASELRKCGRKPDLYRNIGDIYETMRCSGTALRYLERSLALYKKEERTEKLPGTYRQIGKVYQRLGVTQKALRAYEKAYELSKEGNLTKDLGDVLIELGGFKDDLGDFNGAEKCYQELNELLEGSEDPGLKVRLTNNIGMMYYDSDRFKEAIDNFEKMLELASSFEGEKKVEGICRGRVNLGQSLAKSKGLRRARDTLSKAIEDVPDMKNIYPDLYGGYLCGLALVARFEEDLHTAETHLKESIRIYQKDAPYIESEAYMTEELGLVYRDAGRTKKAREALSRARNLFYEVGAISKSDEIAGLLSELE